MAREFLSHCKVMGSGVGWSEAFVMPMTTTGGRVVKPRRRPRSETARSTTADGREVIVRVSACVTGLSFTVRCRWTQVIVWGHHLSKEYLEDLTVEEISEMATTFFKKPPVGKRDGSGGTDPVDPSFEKKYPTLWCYLSKLAFPDGEVRKRSSLIVFCEDGMVKGCLSDKDTEASLWAASGTFTGLLEALEGRLTEDAPEWRAQRKKK